MKKLIAILLATLILILSGCRNADPNLECQADPTQNTSVSQTDPDNEQDGTVFQEEDPEFSTSEPVSQTDSTGKPSLEPSASTDPQETKPAETKPSAGKNDTKDPTKPTEGKKPEGTTPPQTKPTDPATEPTSPPETTPPATEPPATNPPETEPPATEAPTEPETTEPAQPEITYEFKRQVASYAAQYINSYRGSPCTVLSGMSQVAQFRASQLTWNYGHSTSDKRAALAYYEYGRYIDATEFGDDASNSYWEADSAEAICAGFYGTDPEAMGKKIADLIRNSSGHWSYISSSEYSYIGVGVEYREGSEYGWYACVMVGSVNYG